MHAPHDDAPEWQDIDVHTNYCECMHATYCYKKKCMTIIENCKMLYSDSSANIDEFTCLQ